MDKDKCWNGAIDIKNNTIDCYHGGYCTHPENQKECPKYQKLKKLMSASAEKYWFGKQILKGCYSLRGNTWAATTATRPRQRGEEMMEFPYKLKILSGKESTTGFSIMCRSFIRHFTKVQNWYLTLKRNSSKMTL